MGPDFRGEVTDIVRLYSTLLTEPWCSVLTRTNPDPSARPKTQPGLRSSRGRAATMTHDYKRHGTTTLYPR